MAVMTDTEVAELVTNFRWQNIDLHQGHEGQGPDHPILLTEARGHHLETGHLGWLPLHMFVPFPHLGKLTPGCVPDPEVGVAHGHTRNVLQMLITRNLIAELWLMLQVWQQS